MSKNMNNLYLLMFCLYRKYCHYFPYVLDVYTFTNNRMYSSIYTRTTKQSQHNFTIAIKYKTWPPWAL